MERKYYNVEQILEALSEVGVGAGDINEVLSYLGRLPSVQHQYEPVTVKDFAKTMSENTIYGSMAWYGVALDLMKTRGFVICKKTI